MIGVTPFLLQARNTNCQSMTRNYGANWRALQPLQGQALSFKVTDSHDRTVIASNVFPANWQFGQTATAPGF
ncbi:expansin C-terminal domain-related protein [Streptomyces sp. NPDC051555]|uniref:expansin C-terminal domain-related protein n=1 Tax=Streptomyces sp. NPDC051555 TaxID=3365657 RepID=UPI003799927D